MIEAVHREQWGRLLSILAARTRRLDLVEDALGEAFVRATERWPADGVPDNPAAWLYTVAHRQVIGRIRSEAVAARKALSLVDAPVHDAPPPGDLAGADDRLELILLCCHRDLRPDVRAALALRLVIGTPTETIARLFLVSTPTMAARLTRAKQRVVAAGIEGDHDAPRLLADRLDDVCRTVYLAFTTGYQSPADPDGVLVAGDAVRLAAILHDLRPTDPQVRALLALCLLQHARRHARIRDGRLVLFEDQDRALWCHDEIRAGLALLEGFGPTTGFGEELRLQALIAAVHARSRQPVDWATIASLYGRLEALTGSPMVRLNRAVAVAQVDGPLVALGMLEGVEGLTVGDHRLAAVRAELAGRAGDTELARASYVAALETCPQGPERRHLEERLAELGDG